MKILTTLAERDYFLGVAALINSIVEHGTYVDKVVIGYRGELPEWLPRLEQSSNGQSCELPSGLLIELVPVLGDLHMVHEKPKWFKYLTEVLEPNAIEYFFFDSDIIVINRMSFFGEWVKQGVAICEDVNYDMASNHPIRKQWIEIAKIRDLKVNKQLERYYNSGFIGWTKKTSNFINEWEYCCRILGEKSTDLKQFRVINDRSMVVLSANQDSLNLAAMITEEPLSTIGPEAMGFRFGFPLMEHPIAAKPWRRNFLKDFLRGYPPRVSDLLFWNYVNGSELQPLSSSLVKRKSFVCKLFKGLARIYRRN